MAEKTDNQTNIFSEVSQDRMEYAEFLTHFFEIVQRYLKSTEKLDKIFDLYVVQQNKSKGVADTFRKQYLASLSEYSKQANEIAFLFRIVQAGDNRSAQFVIDAKQRLLAFYDHDRNDLSVPLTEIKVPIKDWLNLLKSFPFFFGEVSKKLEVFKRFLAEENEDFSNISGLDFVKAILQFSQKSSTDDDQIKRRLTKKSASPVRFSTAFNNLKLGKTADTSPQIHSGRFAHKLGENVRGFLEQPQRSKEEQIKQLQRHLYKESRIKRLTQQAYYEEIESLKKNSLKYDELSKVVEEMRITMLRLVEVGKKNGGAQSNLNVDSLVEKSSREELALNLFDKMRTIGF